MLNISSNDYIYISDGDNILPSNINAQMYKLRLLIYLLLISVQFKLHAQDIIATSKWNLTDIEFAYKSKTENPFDLKFGAVLTHEGGFSTSIPAFYNGEDTWIIRFCPDLEGLWKYETFSSASKLAGKIGVIQVTANEKLDEHGPIVISKTNPQKVAYADGSPYFLMAFELDWLFAIDATNNEDIPNTKQIISDVAKNKFNHIVMNVYAFDANWGERDKIDPLYNFAEPAVFPFGGSNENPDYSTLNIDFFKHLDRVIAHLDEKEIIAHLMIYVWNKKVNWPQPESEGDNLYFDYVVKRYQGYPNLVWDISKEATAYGRDDMGYITRRIDRLRKIDGHGRLLSVHDYGYCAQFPDKVDFISIQNWRPNIYNVMLEVNNRHPGKPIFNIEHGGYERSMHTIFTGAYQDAVTCLERNYSCVFAGAYSTYYWQNSSWYEVVYEPFTLPKEKQPNFSYYKHLANLFQAFDFTHLEPDTRISNTFCLTDHQSTYLFYITEGMISLQGSFKELKDKKVKVRWFDPFTGLFHGTLEHSFGTSTWKNFLKDDDITSPFCVAVLEVMD